MQSVPGWPAADEVSRPVARVMVNGVEREAASVTVTRELNWSPTGSGGGVTAATGDVSWRDGEDVVTRSPHPWSLTGWPPRPGDEVSVDVGVEGASGPVLVRQLTGRVDGVAGSLADGSASSRLVDQVDRLNQSLTFDTALAVIPGPGSTRWRVSLTGEHLVDRTLRACGFYATPPADDGCVVSLPLIGSAVPEVGLLSACAATGGGDPVWALSPWGYAAKDLAETITPDLAADPGRLTSPLQITFCVGSAPFPATGSATITARWGSSSVSVGVASTGNVTSQFVDGPTINGPTLPVGSGRVFTLLVRTTGQMSIYSDDGRSATGGTFASPSSAMTGGGMTSFEVTVPPAAADIGGIQASFGSTDPLSQRFTPSAVIKAESEVQTFNAFPAVVNRRGLDLLTGHARAVVAAFWLDEAGVAHWVDRSRIFEGDPVLTLTADDNLLDLEWESTLDSLRSGITIDYRTSLVRISNTESVTLWEGGGETLESGQTTEEFIGPGADEEWLGVDWVIGNIAAPGGNTAINQGRTSLTGGTLVEDGLSDVAAGSSAVTTTLSQVDVRRWRLTNMVGSLPAGKLLTMRVPALAIVSESQRGARLPVIRGRGKVSFSPTSVGFELGRPEAPALQHDAGPFVQRADTAVRLVDWFLTHTGRPAPVVRSLPIVPDPRVQLGDKVTIEDPARSGVRLTCIVTGIDLRASSGQVSQSLSVHVIFAARIWPSLAEWDESIDPTTSLSAFDVSTAQNGRTLAAFDADPLLTDPTL